MVKSAKGCAFGLLLGTLLRTISVVVEFLARVVSKVLVLFGLWIPLVYALFGVILFYIFDFNPFDFSLYSSLYLSGAVACVVCCVIISIRNIIVRPAKSVFDGYKHPLWEKNREKNIEKENKEFEKYVVEKRGDDMTPPEIDDFSSHKYHKKGIDYLPPSGDFEYRTEDEKPKFKVESINSNEDSSYVVKLKHKEPLPFIDKVKSEKPSVYFSKLEPELLVHEYTDRFELFKIQNNRSILDRVEYK